MSEEQSRDVPLVDGNDASIQSERDEDTEETSTVRRLFSHCMGRETFSGASLPYLSEVNGTKLKAWFLRPADFDRGLVARRSDGTTAKKTNANNSPTAGPNGHSTKRDS